MPLLKPVLGPRVQSDHHHSKIDTYVMMIAAGDCIPQEYRDSEVISLTRYHVPPITPLALGLALPNKRRCHSIAGLDAVVLHRRVRTRV